MEGLIFNIRSFSVNDGPGIRTTVFFKGCPLNCIWCHNPESKSFENETFLITKRLDSQTFEMQESVGKYYDVSQVVEIVSKDSPFFEQSGGGVTISGGEPLSQPVFLIELLRSLKSKGLHIAIDTCGYAPWENLERTIPFTNLYLYDLKIVNDEDHIKNTGKSNSLILSNLSKLDSYGIPIHLRLPMVLGITDTDENMLGIIRIVSELKNIQRIDILPYHTLAKHKSNRLYGNYSLNDLNDYPRDKAEQILNKLQNLAPVVSIGG